MSRLPPIADPATLAATCGAWHALAERVLAVARFRASGRIGLRATPGGFGTPPFGDGDEIRVDGTQLVVTRVGVTTVEPITTLRAAADLAGVEPDASVDVYTPTTTIDPSAELAIDPDATVALAAWLELGTALLEALRASAAPADEPSEVQLWPEHFDLGLELGRVAHHERATFGASPGDASHLVPYLYVTRWADVPDDDFWDDEAFPGASRSYSTLAAPTDATTSGREFFAAARAVLTRSA